MVLNCISECVVGDQTYQSGEKFDHEGGCNECFCKNGRVMCTDLLRCKGPGRLQFKLIHFIAF